MTVLLTPDEVAKILRVSRRTLQKLQRRPDFAPKVKLSGKCYRWRSEDLQAWITKSAQEDSAA